MIFTCVGAQSGMPFEGFARTVGAVCAQKLLCKPCSFDIVS